MKLRSTKLAALLCALTIQDARAVDDWQDAPDDIEIPSLNAQTWEGPSIESPFRRGVKFKAGG